MITTPYTNVSKRFYRRYKLAQAPFLVPGGKRLDGARVLAIWDAREYIRELRFRPLKKFHAELRKKYEADK